MNLVIDIGNSRIKFAVFDNEELIVEESVQGHALTEMPSQIVGKPISAAILSSVIDLPQSTMYAINAMPLPVLKFSSSTPIPLRNAYRTPHTLGADRLAAAVGAWTLCKGKPLLIIDAGSCITFDMVSAAGEYLGGNISPGLHARLRAIDEYFPRLPLVEADGDLPELGYDTETAIRSGVIQGMRHEIEGYVRFFQQRHPDFHVFITGGDTFNLTLPDAIHAIADPHIVERGLNTILEYNKEQL